KRFMAACGWSGDRIAVGADRSAAAGIEPPIGWNWEQWGARERAERQFAGEDRPFFRTQRPIGAARDEICYESQIRSRERVGRLDRELRTIAGCRVQQIIGSVEFYVGRHADQRVMLGTLR